MLLLCHPLNSLVHYFHFMPITQKFCFDDGWEGEQMNTHTRGCDRCREKLYIYVSDLCSGTSI